MSPELCDEFERKPNSECDCLIFESKDEMNKSIKRLCYGDLYVIGRLWIESMKSVLVGSKLCIIPVVEAAKPPPPPQKPPKMKCKDLPIYQSPHSEYYEFEADKLKCPDYKKKILHSALLPYVRTYRREAQKQYRETQKMLQGTCKDVCCYVNKQKQDILCYARCPSRLNERRIAVALGATVGLLIGCKTGKGVTKPMIYSGLGALAMGALCFPKETDETFRTVCYHTGMLVIDIYNLFCKRNFSLRGRIPCESEIPPPTKKRKEQCPVKK